MFMYFHIWTQFFPDTVNTAARMCKFSKQDSIRCSAQIGPLLSIFDRLLSILFWEKSILGFVFVCFDSFRFILNCLEIECTCGSLLWKGFDLCGETPVGNLIFSACTQLANEAMHAHIPQMFIMYVYNRNVSSMLHTFTIADTCAWSLLHVRNCTQAHTHTQYIHTMHTNKHTQGHSRAHVHTRTHTLSLWHYLSHTHKHSLSHTHTHHTNTHEHHTHLHTQAQRCYHIRIHRNTHMQLRTHTHTHTHARASFVTRVSYYESCGNEDLEVWGDPRGDQLERKRKIERSDGIRCIYGQRERERAESIGNT